MSLLAKLFDTRTYIPILSVKPAEMRALEELPEFDKDRLMPLILLRKWLGSKDFSKTLSRVVEASGNRPWLADLDQSAHLLAANEVEPTSDADEYLRKLADPENGYRNWLEFISQTEAAVPCMQIEKAVELSKQVSGLKQIGRGVVVRVTRARHGNLGALIGVLLASDLKDVLFVLDFEQIGVGDLFIDNECVKLIDLIQQQMKGVPIAVSATSFPDNFVGVPNKLIAEREFFERIRKLRPEAKLSYSDRASARGKMIDGGSGTPPPRIDYPLFDEWKFFRRETTGYTVAASDLIKSDVWNPNLKLWGTQMIERTALNDPYGINTATKSTAVRMNIHMHNQVHYYDPEKSTFVDEAPWVD